MPITFEEAFKKARKKEERQIAFEERLKNDEEFAKSIQESKQKSLAYYNSRKEKVIANKRVLKEFSRNMTESGIRIIPIIANNNVGRIAYKINENDEKTSYVEVAYTFCSPSDRFSRTLARAILNRRINSDNKRYKFCFSITREIAEQPEVIESTILGFMKRRIHHGIGIPQRKGAK